MLKRDALSFVMIGSCGGGQKDSISLLKHVEIFNHPLSADFSPFFDHTRKTVFSVQNLTNI